MKASWAALDRALQLVGHHLAESGRTALLLGDRTLRNPVLLSHLARPRFLDGFEPLDEPFLRGVVRQRLDRYLGEGRHVDDIIAPELYEVLAPAGLAGVSSFRTVLAFLEGMAADLPSNDATCRMTLPMARRRAEEHFDPYLSPRQERFLNILLDHLGAHHPRGAGLEDGLDREVMSAMGKSAGGRSWDHVADEIVEPLCESGILLALGTPGLDEHGAFARYIEPFFPSLPLMLLADE